MARGKNKAVAERRKAALVEIGSIDSLRLEIKNLKEELEKTKRSAAFNEGLKLDNIAELNRRLKENTSIEVEELKATVDDLKKQLGESRKKEDQTSKRWSKAIDYMVGHFEKEHNMPRHEAAGMMFPATEEDWSDGIPVIADTDLVNKARAGKLTDAQVKLLQRKRMGYR